MPRDDDAPSGLAAAPPPPEPGAAAPPDVVESYVRAAMHSDRTPGVVLAVCHPLRMYKVPRGLLDALRARRHEVEVVETHPDRVASVTAIRDALLACAQRGKPLDVMVFSGDGSLDHHVLIGAFWAFYPALVGERPGRIAVEPPSDADWAAVDPALRRAFLQPLPTGEGLKPTEATIQRIWVLRRRIERAVRNGRSSATIERRAGVSGDDPLLRLAVLATVLPHRVTLEATGFDLSGLAAATQEQSFQGLYPFIRSIAVYPAGTAADNALYAGIPGYAYAQSVRWLERLRLGWLREAWEERALDQFQRVREKLPA